MTVIEQTVLAAFTKQRDPISDSDLDDEQPIALTVHTTLGECRGLQRMHASELALNLARELGLETLLGDR